MNSSEQQRNKRKTTEVNRTTTDDSPMSLSSTISSSLEEHLSNIDFQLSQTPQEAKYNLRGWTVMVTPTATSTTQSANQSSPSIFGSNDEENSADEEGAVTFRVAGATRLAEVTNPVATNLTVGGVGGVGGLTGVTTPVATNSTVTGVGGVTGVTTPVETNSTVGGVGGVTGVTTPVATNSTVGGVGGVTGVTTPVATNWTVAGVGGVTAPVTTFPGPIIVSGVGSQTNSLGARPPAMVVPQFHLTAQYPPPAPHWTRPPPSTTLPFVHQGDNNVGEVGNIAGDDHAITPTLPSTGTSSPPSM